MNKVGYFTIILKKKKNNFISSVIESTVVGKHLIFNKSCGMLPGIRGSKKYTTVALESLGKESFFVVYEKGCNFLNIDFLLKFRLNKFIRSFLKGFFLYLTIKNKVRLNYRLVYSHNGVRARKPRRV